MRITTRMGRGAGLAVAVAVACGSSGVAAQGASSQAAGGQELEEIVVTARKRDESLQTVPLAVSVFRGEDLVSAGVRSLEDLTGLAPGLFFSDQGGQFPGRYNSSIRFRGMQTNQIAASQQLGTMFLDGVYVSGGVSSLGFDNVESVEVIKGPQSAQFGRGTFGGAINLVTRAPGFEHRTRLTAEVAQFGTQDIIASHEGPLSDRVAFRVSGRLYGTDGEYRSGADGGRLGEERTQTLEGSLLIKPVDGLNLRIRGMYSEDSDGAPAGMFLGGPNSRRGAGPNLHNCQVPGRVSFFCGEIPKVNLNGLVGGNTALTPALINFFAQPTATSSFGGTGTIVGGVPSIDHVGLERRTLRAALIGDYTFGNGYRIDVISGYNEMKLNWIRDFDQSAAANWYSQDPQKVEDFSQEIRLSSPADQRFRFMLGASYFSADYAQELGGGKLIWNYDGQLSFPPYTPGPVVFIAGNTPIEGARTKSLFGSVGFDILSNLTLDVEARSQKEDVSQTVPAGPGPKRRFEQSFSNFLPRVTLSFRPTERTTLWATYSEGNIPGFFNGFVAALTPSEIERVKQAAGGNVDVFNKEETLENYEVGVRQLFLDGRARVAISAYRADWTDQKTRQGVQFARDSGAVVLALVTTNNGNTKLSGFEIEGGARLTENLELEASVAKAEGEFEKFVCPLAPYVANTATDCLGKRPPQFPDVTGSAALTWTNRLTDNWDWYTRLDVRYIGKMYCDESNSAYIGATTLGNASVGFTRDRVRVEGFVRNAGDNQSYLNCARWGDYSVSGFNGNTNQGVALTPPSSRQVGLRVQFEF
jgi:iron complex outermembrane receptor protein